MSLLIQISDKNVFGFTLTIFNSMFLLSLSKFQHIGGGKVKTNCQVYLRCSLFISDVIVSSLS